MTYKIEWIKCLVCGNKIEKYFKIQNSKIFRFSVLSANKKR